MFYFYCGCMNSHKKGNVANFVVVQARRADGGISRRAGASARCEASKQRRHPGSASEAQQVPAFPLKGGCRKATEG